MYKRILASGAGLAACVLGLMPAASARADSTATLPITSFYQMVADSAHGHLFISQGSATSDDILVTNLAGAKVATITGQDGVNGLVLSPDGATLYAALGSADAVSAISTSTLKQTASYPLGSGNSPLDVAVQSGKVWVSYNAGVVGTAAIGDVNLSAATPAFETQANMDGWYTAPQIAADPENTGVLVAAQPSESPSSVASYNTTVDPASVRDQSDYFSNCYNEQDLAVAPGGAEFVLACGAPYAHYRYSTTDLSELGSYPSTTYPDAVAIDAEGDVAAGTDHGADAPDVYIYRQDGTTPLSTFDLSGSGELAPGGLAWSADGSKLFAVTSSGSSYSLQILDNPTLAHSTLTLTGPATAYIGRKLTLTGTLAFNSAAPPAGTPITITRSVRGSTATAQFNVKTAADGSFTLTNTPPALGTYTYAAAYAGNATTTASTASHAVTVTRARASLTLRTSHTTYTYKPVVHVTAHLGPTYRNRAVSIYARRFGTGARHLLKAGKVSKAGNLSVSYPAAHSTVFSVAYSGDARDAPRTVTRDVRVRARVGESVSGYYGHKRIGGVTYWLYHSDSLLYARATVAPDKAGECVKFFVQEHYQGAWHDNVSTNCLRISRSSTASASFGLTQADRGYHYRIRAEYLPRHGDTSNVSNYSGWRYVIIYS